MKAKVWKLIGLISIMIFALSTAVSVHAQLTTIINVGGGPFALAYDSSTNEVFVVNGGGEIQVISSDNTVTSTITTLEPSSLYYITYDSGTGDMWLGGSSGVVAMSSTGQVIANIPLGGVESSIAYDSGTSQLFVPYYNSNDNSYTLGVISDSSPFSIVANITLPGVSSPVYDPAQHEIFAIADDSSGNPLQISVISDSNDQIAKNITVSTLAASLVYDSKDDEIFALTAQSTLVVISGKTDQILTTIPNLNIDLWSTMAYDSGKDYIYMNGASDVNVVSASTNKLLGTVNDNGTVYEDETPEGITYNSGTSMIYAINNGGSDASPDGSIAVISDGSTGTSPSATPSSTTTATSTPTSTQKVPEFSSAALTIVVMVMAAIALCAVAYSKKKRDV